MLGSLGYRDLSLASLGYPDPSLASLGGSEGTGLGVWGGEQHAVQDLHGPCGGARVRETSEVNVLLQCRNRARESGGWHSPPGMCPAPPQAMPQRGPQGRPQSAL